MKVKVFYEYNNTTGTLDYAFSSDYALALNSGDYFILNSITYKVTIKTINFDANEVVVFCERRF